MHKGRSRLFAFAFLIAGTGAIDSAGQGSEQSTIAAVRVPPESVGIRVDGSLDEPVWRSAPAATGLRQREPDAGAPASERTEVRVAYDGSNLYVAIRAFDDDPGAVIARILQRDKVMEPEQFTLLPRFAGDDAVAILLDPFHDHRNAFIFATNPNGAEFEALLTDEGREFNIDWRGVWTVATGADRDGWTAEFAIPFRTLRYPNAEGEQQWGFNVYRVIRRKNEEVLWNSWTRETGGFHRVSQAGHLQGLVDLPRAGVNLEVKPYLLTGFTQEQKPGRLDTDPTVEPGVDVKYEVSPGLLLVVTLNTDFAQVEVDDAQVNLTRFDLFFPEKREFFLENAGIFEFGWKGFFEPPPYLLFFSRSIGIDPDSGAVPVIGGVRLSGRAGKQTVGLINVVTDAAFGAPATNFAVARAKRDVAGSGYVGGMVVDRRSRDESNTGGGLDFSYWYRGAVNVQGFVAYTSTDGSGGDDLAYRLGVDYTGDRFGFSAGYLFVGPETTADAGFVTRTDIRRTDLLGRFTPRPSVLGLRKIDIFGLGQLIARGDGVMQDWQAGYSVGPEWETGDGVSLFFIRGFTRLDESFELREDDDPAVEVTVPEGDYDLWQTGMFGSTSRNRVVVLSTQLLLQGIYDGHLHSLSGTITASPGSKLSLSASYTRNLVSVPDGSFNADIASVRIGYSFSTRLLANALMQYNGLDRELSANLRLNFIHRPGSDLFVVFNEQRGSDDSLWDIDNRTAVVKVTYLARL